jgi:hypothetical protein
MEVFNDYQLISLKKYHKNITFWLRRSRKFTF